MAPVTFNEVPANLRIPYQAVELDASQASQGPGLLPYRHLILGQKLSGGSATANTLYRVTSAAQVIPLAGRGSMLHRQAIAHFKANRETECWIGVLADDGAGVAAAGTITVTGPATADGTISLYIGGELVPVGVLAGDEDTDIADAIDAAINANPDLAVTSSVADEVVTITYRHKGEVGNGYDMRHSYADGQALPAGVGLAFVQLTGGTTNPALATLIANMGNSWFHVWAHGYTDATSLAAIENELSSRSGPMRQMMGVAITSAEGSHSALTTLGDGRNSGFSVILAQPGQNPITPPIEFAAVAAALISKEGARQPNRPLQTVAMPHVLPPIEVDRFDPEERNLLLYDGIGTTVVGPGGVVQLERVVTTYQENAAGAPDDAYLDVTTVLTLMLLRYTWRTRLQTNYPRHLLASDGTKVGPGQPVMTPKLGKAEALLWFEDMQDLTLVEGFEQFKAELVAERNVSDPNRMDWRLPPDLVNQFIVGATQLAFRL